MARVTGKNGSVTLTAADLNLDANSWRVRADHPVDDDTSYADTGSGASHSGSGTVTYSASVTGFLKSNVATTEPGIGTVAGVANMADVDGASMTLTAHTSCTYTGVGICAGAEISHAKRAGAIPVSFDFMIDGDLVEAWATA